MVKRYVIVILIFAAMFIGLPFNISLHEAGHYAVASYYGANPKVMFNITESGFGFYINKPVAETIYSAKTTAQQDFWIALAGPAVNLATFFILAAFLAVIKVRNSLAREFTQYIAITALLAFFMNIFPAGGTDGAVILGLLK